jgi:hypothetical protein
MIDVNVETKEEGLSCKRGDSESDKKIFLSYDISVVRATVVNKVII